MNVMRIKGIFDKNPLYHEIVESTMFVESVDEYFIDYGREGTTYYTLSIFCTGEDETSRIEDVIRNKLDFISDISINIEKPENWIEKWKQSLRPMVITKKIVIDPYPDEEDKVRIIKIIPGMAFGTGEHETTKLAAFMLEKHIKKGDTVLDVGCGTAVQSMVAALNGAKTVTAVDLDPFAVTSAKEIVQLNGLSDVIEVYRSDLLESVEGEFDLIIANIIFEVLILLFEDKSKLKKLLKKDGKIIFSGIIDKRADAFRELLQNNDFEILEENHENVWHAFVVKIR